MHRLCTSHNITYGLSIISNKVLKQFDISKYNIFPAFDALDELSKGSEYCTTTDEIIKQLKSRQVIHVKCVFHFEEHGHLYMLET